jgi:hypothetical protein
MAIHTWTDSPKHAIWNHLRFLSHLSNAMALLRGDLGGTVKRSIADHELTQRKARQLSSCIQQAEEFYAAAEHATVNTSPLLLYYGMFSLAKALVVANHPSLLLDSINYHGLKRSKDELDEVPLEDVHLVTDGGAFEEFMKITVGNALPRHAKVKFRDLLSVLPSVSDFFSRYYRQSPRCLPLYDSFGGGTDQLISVSISSHKADGALTVEQIYEVIPDLEPDFLHEETKAAHVFRAKDLRSWPEYMGKYESPLGGRYLIGCLPTELEGRRGQSYVSPPVAEYMLVFLLSDCVRYRQEFWGRVVSGEQTGILGLINLVLSQTIRQFPNLILDQLFGELFTYGSPAYLG